MNKTNTSTLHTYSIYTNYFSFTCAIPSRNVAITTVHILIPGSCTLEQKIYLVMGYCVFISASQAYLFSRGLPGELRSGQAIGRALKSHHVSFLPCFSRICHHNHWFSWKGSTKAREQGGALL